jgi:hypothetical protein
MHSVLVVAAKPIDKQDRFAWPEFLKELSEFVQRHDEVETLSETTWLILLQNGLSTFSRLSCMCEERRVPYQVLFFENPPCFISSK